VHVRPAPDFVLDIHQDQSGAITAVGLRERQPDAPESEADPIDDVAHRFRDFARGDGDLPRMAAPVDLYLGKPSPAS
jgi:hypothetical protein